MSKETESTRNPLEEQYPRVYLYPCRGVEDRGIPRGHVWHIFVGAPPTRDGIYTGAFPLDIILAEYPHAIKRGKNKRDPLCDSCIDLLSLDFANAPPGVFYDRLLRRWSTPSEPTPEDLEFSFHQIKERLEIASVIEHLEEEFRKRLRSGKDEVDKNGDGSNKVDTSGAD